MDRSVIHLEIIGQVEEFDVVGLMLPQEMHPGDVMDSLIHAGV